MQQWRRTSLLHISLRNYSDFWGRRHLFPNWQWLPLWSLGTLRVDNGQEDRSAGACKVEDLQRWHTCGKDYWTLPRPYTHMQHRKSPSRHENTFSWQDRQLCFLPLHTHLTRRAAIVQSYRSCGKTCMSSRELCLIGSLRMTYYLCLGRLSDMHVCCFAALAPGL